ncbi:hypothetical protein P5G62_010185 [Neobacillus sp. 179-C4.2 HS]|uniref:Uncharacterized protein n=1 Tax=Neobacillus driksii TaxID=3035913 RepID=A0ABV4YRI5_9BACI|nr:hypothetical protein [Neobacillus sp. 179.-C4.2 HS]MDP5195050.1 hypothetical protein [Neobacillus sp. 179.-C4.2 HS]
MISISNNVKVEFPEGVLNGKKIEDIIISPINKLIGVAVVSGKLKNLYLLRLYQLVTGEGWPCYVPTHEIGAFTFHTRKKMDDFVLRLPEFSGFL